MKNQLLKGRNKNPVRADRELVRRSLMRLTLLVTLLSATNVIAQTSDPLQRAIKAIGGEAALERAGSISVVMIGTQDLNAIDQGYHVGKPSPQRQQETLIIDEPTRRAVYRREGTWSDGSPTVWRWAALGDRGYSLKVKTGGISRMNKKQTAVMYEGLRWRIPHLALADMKKSQDKLRCGEQHTVNGRVYDICRFETESGTPFSVLFSRETGHLAGYEYTAPHMRGAGLMRYSFKSYVASTIGLFPSGYSFTVAGQVFKDLNLVDARPAVLAEHPWLVAPLGDPNPISTVLQQPPASVEEVAPGVWFLRNVGGYNSMFARVGDCVAVFDAPASYGHVGEPLPAAEKMPDTSAIIINKVLEVTGKRVCYVVPTHHHNDHFGGIAGFAQAGATIITTPGNEALAKAVVQGSSATAEEPKIQLVREKLTLGGGLHRIDIWVLPGDTHAEGIIFIHLPGSGIAFEGDLSDYVPSAWNFLRFVHQKGLKIDRVYSSHSSRPHSLQEIQWEEPVN